MVSSAVRVTGDAFATAVITSVEDPAPVRGVTDNQAALLAALQLQPCAATTSMLACADVGGTVFAPLNRTVQRNASGPVRSEIDAPPHAASIAAEITESTQAATHSRIVLGWAAPLSRTPGSRQRCGGSRSLEIDRRPLAVGVLGGRAVRTTDFDAA
jgi:hypothetical protein